MQALTTLQQMAVTDKSVFLDTRTQIVHELFNSGKIGMMVTGPWALAQLPDVDYGVKIMPTYDGSAGGHQTIAGPDMWVVFDNGDGRKRPPSSSCSGSPQPSRSRRLHDHRPPPDPRLGRRTTRRSSTQLDENAPGGSTFAQNLENVKKARPVVAQYPEISEALGEAIVAVCSASPARQTR